MRRSHYSCSGRSQYMYHQGLSSDDSDSDDAYAQPRRRRDARRYEHRDEEETLAPKRSNSTRRSSGRSKPKDRDNEPPKRQRPQATETAESSSKPAPPSRPKGWERRVNEKGRIYWVNHDTRESHWDGPGTSPPESNNERAPQEENVRLAGDDPVRIGEDRRPGVVPNSEGLGDISVLESRGSRGDNITSGRPRDVGVAHGIDVRDRGARNAYVESGESEDEVEDTALHTSPRVPGSLHQHGSHVKSSPTELSSPSSSENLPSVADYSSDADFQAALGARRKYFELKEIETLKRARLTSLEAADKEERRRLWLEKEEQDFQTALRQSLVYEELEAAPNRRRDEEQRRRTLDALAENARLAREQEEELEAKRKHDEAVLAENRRLAEDHEHTFKQRQAEEALQNGYRPGETEEELLERVIRASLEDDMRRAAELDRERNRLYRDFGGRVSQVEQPTRAASSTNRAAASPNQEVPASPIVHSRQRRMREPGPVIQDALPLRVRTNDHQAFMSGRSPSTATSPMISREPMLTDSPTTRTRSHRRTTQERPPQLPAGDRASPAREFTPMNQSSTPVQASPARRSPSLATQLPEIQGQESRRNRPTRVRAGPVTARQPVTSAPSPSLRSSPLTPTNPERDVAEVPVVNSPPVVGPPIGLTPEEQAREEAMLQEALRLSAQDVAQDPEDGDDDPPPPYEEAWATS